MKSKVSLLIPCFNGEKYIQYSIDSVLNQTYNNVQVIIINDGSTDKSEEMILKYRSLFLKKGYEFDYIYKKNGGAASAINEGLRYVNGEYIMLFDIDDYLLETAIEKKADFLNNNTDYVMVWNNVYIVKDRPHGIILEEFIKTKDEKQNEYIFEDLLYGRTNNWPGSFMVRTKTLFNNLNNREIYISQYGQNLQIMLPVAIDGKSGFIDEHLMHYIRHQDAHSFRKSIQKQLELINGYEENRIKIVESFNIEEHEKLKLIEKIKQSYYRNRFYFAYNYNLDNLIEIEYKNLKSINSITFKDIVKYKIYRFKFLKKIVRKIKNIESK